MAYTSPPSIPILAAIIVIISLGGCATWISYEKIGHGDLQGKVFVEWDGQDKFIYRPQKGKHLTFKPSWFTKDMKPIDPPEMYTDGGSIPRALWGIPGLSPWGLGPAYIIHDYLFEVHRCNRPAPPEVAGMSLGDAALALGQTAKALVEAGLIKDNLVELVVAGVQTGIAREIWNRPGTEEECKPPPAFAARRAGARTVVDFEIPPPRRRLP